jgi:hypothetical protein
MPGSRKTRGRSSGRLSTINPDAAGIDVGSTFHVVAVSGDRDDDPVRTFRTFSGELHRLADWLEETGIKTVAMESTGVYWIPVFEILEAHGFEVLLVNARDVKNVPGRKTDVTGWFVCAPTCAIEDGWWTTPPPTSSTCRRRSCR